MTTETFELNEINPASKSCQYSLDRKSFCKETFLGFVEKNSLVSSIALLVLLNLMIMAVWIYGLTSALNSK